MRSLIFFSSLFLLLSFLRCQPPLVGAEPPAAPLVFTPALVYDSARHWVDSVYLSMSEEERIARLFWLAVEQVDQPAAYARLRPQVKRYQPGGVLLMGMPLERVSEVVSDLQSLSKRPMLVSVDGEWGAAMRFKDLPAFPYAMTLGALANDSLVYLVGLEIARQMRMLGIHVNMAPVADVNSNPDNPIIGHRSFGEQAENVARKSVAYMRGLQDGGVMAVGKHFPGHGDTDSDSHHTLPVVKHNRALLDSTDLLPFKAMIEAGLWGMMTAHIEVPALDGRAGLPASFSDSIVKGLLREDLGFEGLVLTDALNMQGARVMGRPGEVDMLALKAGNDVVEFTEDLPGAIAAVKKALADSLLCPHEMEAKCRRALAFQYWLSERPQVKGVDSVLHTDETLALNRLLYEAALTVLHNEAVLPFASKRLDQQEVLLLGTAPVLRDSLRSLGLKVQNLALHDPAAFRRQLAGVGEEVGLIFVIGDSQWGRRAANAALRQEVIQLLKRKQALTVFMGNAYHLAPWRELDASGALVLAYENNDRTQEAVWRLLTGHIGANGRLPVSISQWYAAGSGIDLAPLKP
ncbi:MAG TPA: hypothetical protein GXZ39_00980 [Bacteroidales bacterium]|nr:hypothetical protein [Bacteroidales bacterium]